MTTTATDRPPEGGRSKDAEARRRVDFGHASLAVRVGPIGLRWQVRSLVVCTIIVLLTLGLAVWAVTLGDYPTPTSPGSSWWNGDFHGYWPP